MELYRNHELQPKPPGKLHPYNSLCPQSFAAIWCYMEPPSKLYASTSTTTSYTLQPHGQLSVPYSTASPKWQPTPGTDPQPLLLPKSGKKQHKCKEQPLPQLNRAVLPASPNLNNHECYKTYKKTKNKTKNNTTSWRTIQRRKKIKIKKKSLTNKLYHTKRLCLASFGFCSDPEQSKCNNFKSALSNITPTPHKQPTT